MKHNLLQKLVPIVRLKKIKRTVQRVWTPPFESQSSISTQDPKRSEVPIFTSLFREDAIEFRKTLKVTPDPSLCDVLTMSRKEYAREDFEKMSRYRCEQISYDPPPATFLKSLKHLKKTAKRIRLNNPWFCQFYLLQQTTSYDPKQGQCCRKKDARVDEIRDFIQSRYEWEQLMETQPSHSFFETSAGTDRRKNDRSTGKKRLTTKDPRCLLSLQWKKPQNSGL